MNRFLRYNTPKVWYVILVLFFVYFTQGILYPQNQITSVGIVGILFLIGIVNFVKAFLTKADKPAFIIWTALFYIMVSITFLISPNKVYSPIDSFVVDTLNQYKTTTIFCLSLFIGYNVGKKNIFTDKSLLISSIVIIVIAIICFVFRALTLTGDASSTNITNNSAYTFLFALPFLALIIGRYPKTVISLTAVCVFFVMAGAKRGAIICMALMMLFAFSWYMKYYKISAKTIIVLAVLLTGTVAYGYHVYMQNEFLRGRFEEMEEGGSSGREELVSTMWEYWRNERDIKKVVFGYGSAQTVAIAGNYAHDDWVELLINNGVLGVVIYLGMFVSVVHFISRNRYRMSRFTYLSMSLWIIYWFLKSIFSMGFDSVFGGLTMLLLGTQLANIQTVKNARALLQRKNH